MIKNIILVFMIVSTTVTSTAISFPTNNAEATSDNTYSVTCDSHQGTTMGGIHHFGTNCQGENGNDITFAGGGFNSDTEACEVHGLQGPNDNIHFRGGCIDK